MTTRKWRDEYDDVYAETDCANLIIVSRQLYFTRKVAQQRPKAPAMAGRAATKPKNSNTRRHTASMPTILPSPASPRNPQLSPLQSWWGLQQWGGPAEVVVACLQRPRRVIITRSTHHFQRWAWSPRGRNVSSSESLINTHTIFLKIHNHAYHTKERKKKRIHCRKLV